MTNLRTDLALLTEWIEAGSHILDLGCGDGTLLVHLRENSQVTGYGLEIDDANITQCIKAGINVIQTDLDEGLSDFEADAFDYVVMTQTLQAIRHPDKLLQEMLRIGAEVIVTFPNFGHWQARWSLMMGHMPLSRALPHLWYDTPNIHLCSLNDFEDLCDGLNIEILQRAVVDTTHKTSLLMRLSPNLMGEIALYRLKKAVK